MSTTAFAWFHNASAKPTESIAFYEGLLGWKSSEGPAGLRLLAGEAGPIAGVAPREGEVGGWIPYAQVEDVDDATRRAVKLGAVVVKEKARGPAGEFTIVRDPGGAVLALWQKG